MRGEIVVTGARVHNLKNMSSEFRASSWSSSPEFPVQESRLWPSIHSMPKARDDILNRFRPTIVNYFNSWTNPTSTQSTDFLLQSRFNPGLRASDRARLLELSARFKIFCGCCLPVSASRFVLNAAPGSRLRGVRTDCRCADGAPSRRAHRSSSSGGEPKRTGSQ